MTADARPVREVLLTIALKNLQVLVIDCQTSGSNVEQSHILEIGWVPMRAGEPADPVGGAPTVHLIRPPQDWQVPAHVEKLTGIDSARLSNGVLPDRAWQELSACARRVARQNQMVRCPAIIHYARFEMGFLDKWAAQSDEEAHMDLEAICTHQLALRLLPALPRKGLRAVAGYIGHSIGKRKRCLDHLLATQAIWRYLVQRLANEQGIVTLDQLRRWLNTPPSPQSAQRTYPMPSEIRLNAPQSPGIYRMHRSNGDLLYIGKATNLKQRINSYFRPGARHSENTLEMLSQAVDLQIHVTGSALEAALLESDEIKRCEPPYNIALTGGRRVLYYLSRDFMHHADQPDDTCRLGPVSALAPFDATAAIQSYLSENRTAIDAEDIPELLAMPQRYCPDPECTAQGIAQFNRKHRSQKRNPLSLNDLLRIGRQSWIDKMNQREDETILTDEHEEPAEPEEFVWTPEAVARSVETILRHCGFLLRRSRWLALLSESAIGWQVRGLSSDQRHVIVLHRGAVLESKHTHLQNPLPESPGVKRTVMERRAALDLTTYDRLRVLTTELRRLVAEQRTPAIRLGRGVCLGTDRLRRLLQWV